MQNVESRRIGIAAATLGNFLEYMLPIVAFATLTTPYAYSRDRIDSVLKLWLLCIQKRERQTLAFVISQELYPQRHLHIALIAMKPIDCMEAEMDWTRLVGNRDPEFAKVAPFENGLSHRN